MITMRGAAAPRAAGSRAPGGGVAAAVGLSYAVFPAAGDYHHHIGLNTFESAGGTAPPAGHTGLYHFALLYPDRRSLAIAARRVLDSGHAIRSAIDHGGSVSLYLSDPDGNGIELYYDRPRDSWYDAQGRPVIKAERFEVGDLLAELDTPAPGAEPLP